MRNLGLLMVVLTACTSSAPTKNDAREGWGANYNMNYGGLLDVLAHGDVTNTAGVVTNCPTSGSITVTGTYSPHMTPIAPFDINTRLDACEFNDGDPGSNQVVDGHMHWTNDVRTQQLEGFVDYRGPSGEFSCSFSLIATVGVPERHAGTVCGYDIHDLDIVP